MAEISITFKAGPGYDEPWVVVKAANADEAYEAIQDLRRKNVFGGVKDVAHEFQQLQPGVPPAPQAPVSQHDQAVNTVQSVMPGSVVISDQELPDSATPHCVKCTKPAQYKSGISKQSGVKYDGWFCLTKDCAAYWKPVK